MMLEFLSRATSGWGSTQVSGKRKASIASTMYWSVHNTLIHFCNETGCPQRREEWRALKSSLSCSHRRTRKLRKAPGTLPTPPRAAGAGETGSTWGGGPKGATGPPKMKVSSYHGTLRSTLGLPTAAPASIQKAVSSLSVIPIQLVKK